MDPSNPTYDSNAGMQSYLLAARIISPTFNSSGYNIISDVTKFGTEKFIVNATPTPEPATLALLGSGLLAIGAARLRRSRRSKAKTSGC
jgi:hypothetical protein